MMLIDVKNSRFYDYMLKIDISSQSTGNDRDPSSARSLLMIINQRLMSYV